VPISQAVVSSSRCSPDRETAPPGGVAVRFYLSL
jgi:hypothetical protein